MTEEISIEQMSAEDKTRKLLEYRKRIAEGEKLSLKEHTEAITLLRSLRSTAIQNNPRATKAAKKKAAAKVPEFDLTTLL